MKVFIFSVLLSVVITADTVFGSPVNTRSGYVVKDSHIVPSRWSRIGSTPAKHWIYLNIGLKQGRFDELEKQLYQVSTPSHASYGKHLTSTQVNELVKPCDDALKQVHDWLQDHDIYSTKLNYTPAKDWISVNLPVSAIERLLDTKYSIYQHEDGTQLVRAPKWSLPTHLHKHIDTIQPTNSFFRPSARRRTFKAVPHTAEFGEEAMKKVKQMTPLKNQAVAQACNASGITPTCLRTLYGTIDYTPKATSQNQIALCNYLDEYRPEAVDVAYTFGVEQVNGGSNQQTPDTPAQLQTGKDVEGDLDAETILGIGYPTPLITYNTGGNPPFAADLAQPENNNEPYLEWLQYVLAQPNIPQVISSSYGDDEQTVPELYARSVCNLFPQLGARGITFLAGSGDNGVGGSGQCVTNDGKNTSTFLASFPDSCPYITSVGATKGFEPEVAAYRQSTGFASGGGFSNYFPRPSYQDAVVPAYVSSLGSQFRGLYNPAGRGYPDISAQGQGFLTIWNGTEIGLDGTSASGPAAAAILSLVNDALIAAGKPVLGFLNPCLYERLHTSFTDVTSGSAVGCNSTGFPAKVGWDAVTGFGTPYFPKVSAAVVGHSVINVTTNGTHPSRS